jgi:hypothetical protein
LFKDTTLADNKDTGVAQHSDRDMGLHEVHEIPGLTTDVAYADAMAVVREILDQEQLGHGQQACG